MFFTRLLDPLPSQCAVCRDWGDEAVCEACTSRFAAPVPRCVRCALQVPPEVNICGACLIDPPAYDSATAGVSYAHPWSALITRFKFHSELDLAQTLVAPLREAVQQRGVARPELLVPVPLSAQRLRERGYNQAWEAARRLAASLQLRADPHLLLRVKESPHQLALPPEARAANVRGVFAVEPLRRDELAGRHVAVLDDVMTTGATFAELARVLKQAGASRVDVWALARTPRAGG